MTDHPSTGPAQREACPLCEQRDDTYCHHPGPVVDTWTCPACGHDWTVQITQRGGTPRAG